MTQQQIQLLYILSLKEDQTSYIEWTMTDIDDDAIVELQDQGLVFISVGEGFIGGLQTLSLTPQGQDFIKDYCDVCECMPCDCGYGS